MLTFDDVEVEPASAPAGADEFEEDDDSRPTNVEDRDEASIATPLPPAPDELPTLVDESELDEPTRMMTLQQAGLGTPESESDAPEPPAPDYEDPHDGLESLPPADLMAEPEPPPPALRESYGHSAEDWPDERPAAAHLAERNLTADWVSRAEWIEGEAAVTDSPAAQARALLLASELWAMAGELERASQTAQKATAASPASPLNTRQLRWLASIEGDHRRAVTTLEAETRAAPNGEARLHSAYLNAHTRRLRLSDADTARQRIELAGKLHPSDPRPYLARIAEHLGSQAEPPRVVIPDEPGLDGMRNALEEVSQRRKPPNTDASLSPTIAFQCARHALAETDADRAAEALAALVAVDGLDRAALWLAASLLAPRSSSRSRAVSFISALLRRERTPMAVRTLLVRALEQGDAKAVQAALDPGDDSSVFAPSDQVVLGALTGAPPEMMDPWLQAVQSDELAPLATAVLSTALPPGTPMGPSAGDPRDTCQVDLGRALGATETSTLNNAIDAFVTEHGESPLARALTLEMALAAGEASLVARQLADWPVPDGGGPGAALDRHLVAALTYEMTGAPEAAVDSYRAALASDPGCEAAVRALLAQTDTGNAATTLVDLANRIPDEVRQALLLVEAAVRQGEDATGAHDELLRRAAELEPELPFATSLGEHAARANGDADALVDWLRLRRMAATDAFERSLHALREALLIADSDSEAAQKLLEECVASRPQDAGLRELHERLVPGTSADKGHWREELASHSEGAARSMLLLTAALQYERAGDQEAAHRAVSAVGSSPGTLEAVWTERMAIGTDGASALAERWLNEVRATEEPVARRELLERLAALEIARGDRDSARRHYRTILEQNPEHLPALCWLEHDCLGGGQPEALEPIATQLVRLLDRQEATAHALLATRQRAASGRWDDSREVILATFARGEPHPWTIRQLSTHSRVAGDDQHQLEADRQLLDRANRPLDGATLALRAAEAAARLGRTDDARDLLERAVDMIPDHLVALATLAEVMEGAGDFENAATALEALARTSNVPKHQLESWHQAAVHWQDRVNDVERARVALEQAVEIDVGHDDTFTRLRKIYVELGDRSSLAELLEYRLDQTTDPDERVALEVTRGQALAEVGDREAAKSALAAALEANPDHLDALGAYADLCLADEDWVGAEQAWIRLARHATEAEIQAEIYRKLGGLYDRQMPNPQRAELSYQEVLKRQPNDVAATERLIEVYGQLSQPERSVELATELVNRASSPDEKRTRTLALARVYDEIVQDRKQAEAILDKARKAYPHDGAVIRSMASFYERHDEARSRQVLLERATTDARRALHTGRFDPAFFGVLSTVAQLQGNDDAAKMAHATLAGLRGEDAALDGVGPAAGNPELDDLLAPDLLSLPLRALLRKAGAILDQAFAFDLQAVRAAPLPPEAAGYVAHVQQVATGFGLGNVTPHLTAALGSVCIPAGTNPPQLVIGENLMGSEDDSSRFFLLLRGLKILQSQGSALSRAAPIDLWPMMAAFLHVLCPSWSAPSVDAKRFAEHQTRLHGQGAAHLDPDVPALAMEVAGSIGNRASQVGTAINQWGNRTALLALGDINAAFRGIALAQGQTAGPPSGGADRMKWIMRNPEARDLAVFSVSDQYAEARRRLGVT